MADSAQINEVSKPALPEAVGSTTQPAKELTFHDITDASAFPPRATFPLWIMITLLAALLVGVILILKKKKKLPIIKKNYYNAALKKLPVIQDSLSTNSVGETSSQLSMALREALKKATHSPALFQTQKEFLSSESLKLKNTEIAQETTSLLNDLWALEYAPPTHDTEKASALLIKTENLLKKLSHS